MSGTIMSVDEAVFNAVPWAVDGAMRWAVNEAVGDAVSLAVVVDEDSELPALEDFLLNVGEA